MSGVESNSRPNSTSSEDEEQNNDATDRRLPNSCEDGNLAACRTETNKRAGPSQDERPTSGATDPRELTSCGNGNGQASTSEPSQYVDPAQVNNNSTHEGEIDKSVRNQLQESETSSEDESFSTLLPTNEVRLRNEREQFQEQSNKTKDEIPTTIVLYQRQSDRQGSNAEENIVESNICVFPVQDFTERRFHAKQEQFRPLQSRRDTFANQHSRFQRPTWEQIAEAGFYYTGCDDECYCFACGCGLNTWEPDDDPWIEHCRYSDDCPYVLEVKGAAFVNRYRRRPEFTAATASNDAGTVGGLSLNHDTNTRRVFNRVSGEHDQNLDLVQRGRLYNVTQEQFRNPFHNQERALNQHNNRNDTASHGDNVQANLETPNLVYPMLVQQGRVLYENRRLKMRLMCHICKTNKVDVLLLPCKDHKFCMDCTHNCDVCPYCSRPIRERIRTHMTGRMN
ncbi:baculoviral IAP repeat-containing protein 7-A-like isoform X2 [Dreissena polymorpha]|uniref:baculoviral IAP repeat-containing protein 7-A-like isoform X2 n=1 Tax=Dreissena polymorpha TaxID=45954 RepID=UPI002264294C|nr:baculoviral IAP repeat-containing protein 7-A-like isoform X2 [Dreissena polymorpha]